LRSLGNEKALTHLRQVDELVLLDGLGDLVDRVGHSLRRRSTVLHVVLDSEVGVGSSGVVRGSEEDTTGSLAVTDDMRDGGGGEDAVLSDDELRDAVTGGELDDLLDDLGRVVASVTTDDEGSVLGTSRDGGEDRLDEVLGVVLLLEDGHTAGGRE